MKYDYRAQVAVIESPERNGTSDGRATIDHSFSSIEKIDAVEKNSCDRGKTWRDMRGSSTSKSLASANQSGVEANVTVGVNEDGTYSVSVGLPPIQGKISGEESATFSGQCTPKDSSFHTIPESPTSIDGNSITSDGTTRIDPADPNKLSGSYTRKLLDITETITWNLQKCGAQLRITDLKFEDMRFPNWNDWREISEQIGTIDGNLVKVKAKVLNVSGETKYADVRFKETFKGDKWDGARPDAPLDDTVLSVRLEPGEEKEVEMVWDSSGFAWFDDGRPRLLQRIKAELEENGKKTDEMTKNLKVAPKPLVLVHGLWSSWRAWESWQNILTTTHSYDWKAFPVGEKPEKGRMNTGGAFLSSDPTNGIFENSQELGKYVRYAQEEQNAWHVDIVAHSMGGLISRHYIHAFMQPVEDGRPRVAHLIMLGTPNMGSPCADVMDVAFSLTGSTPEAIRQLKPAVVAEFNRTVTNRKGVKFSILAGNPLPTMCRSVVWNDGVVPVPSAKWIIKDNKESANLHTELTGTSDFSSFVKPRLAIGPKGDHKPASPDLPQYPTVGSISGGSMSNGRGSMEMFPVYSSGPNARSLFEFSDGALQPFAKVVKLSPGEKTLIDVPIETAMNFGITFMASGDVSATLIDDKGIVVGSNAAHTPAAYVWFRSIFVGKPVSEGTWQLKLENRSDLEQPAIVTTWANAVK